MKTVIYKIFYLMLAVTMLVGGVSFAATSTIDIAMNEASGSTLEGGTELVLTVSDATSKITKIVCGWQGSSSYTNTPNAKTKTIDGIFLGTEAGTYKFDVEATNELGCTSSKTYTYYVEKLVKAEAPVITSSIANGSTVSSDSTLVVYIDCNVKISKIVYNWNSQADTVKYPDSTSTKVTTGSFPKTSGTYKFYITATNTEGLSTTKTFTYYVKDTTAPEIGMSKSSGSTLPGGTELVLTVSDNESKIAKIVCGWEGSTSDTKKPDANEFTIDNILLGTENGTYEFNVTATNAEGLITEKTFIYYVVDGKVEDTTAPEIEMNKKTGSTLPGGTELVLTVNDDESKVTNIVCGWEGSSSDSKNPNVNTYTINGIILGTENGTYKFNVTAKNAEGLTSQKTFIYYVVDGKVEDTTAPEIEMSKKTGSTLPGGTELVLTVNDDESKVTSIVCGWEGSSSDSKNPNVNTYTINGIILGTENGTYKFNVTAKNAEGLTSQKTFVYYVEDEVAAEAPTITPSIASGSNVTSNDILVVYVKNSNTKITQIVYRWNEQTSNTEYPNSTSTKVTTNGFPERAGTYTFYITATNEKGLSTSKTFTYYVGDGTAPEISMSKKSGSTLPGGTELVLTVNDDESLVAKIVCGWEGSTSDTKKPNVNTYKIDGIVIGTENGTYKFNVTATNAEGLTSEDTFIYYVVDGEEDDTKAPTVEAKPSSGDINPAQSIELISRDDTKLDSIRYSWDNTEDVTVKSISGTYDSRETEAPTEPGEHILYVKVTDAAGNSTSKEFTYNIVDENAPTISMNPGNKSTVVGGKVIKATLRDDVELKSVKYNWKGDSATTKSISGTYSVISLPAIDDDEGTYYMYITVTDKAGNSTSEVYVYYVEDKDDEDDEAPTVDADPDHGTLEFGDRVTITAEDDDEVDYVEYYWDDKDDLVKKYDDEFTVKVPSKEGKHYLYVRATDVNDNTCSWEKFIYTIEENNYPGNPDIEGTLNRNVKSVRVEIRNADDKIKYEPEEEIMYYVDYYNGTSSKVSNAKIVVDLPTYFEGIDASDKGKITSTKITWDLGTLDAKEYGRVSFTAQYTSDKYNEKILTIPAKIYSGSSLKDTSTTRNLIYSEDGTGTGSHNAYCLGYPDGSFRPSGNITRAELASMVANMEGISSTYRGQFTDVASTHWAAKYIQACVERGYITSTGYNTYSPDTPATRADIAYAIAAILDVEDLEPIFVYSSDLTYSDARCAMEQLLRLGIMDGYSDGTSRPNNNITRAEAVVIINNYLFRGELYTKGQYTYNYDNGYNFGGNYTVLRFTDLPTSHWAYGHIMEATNNHKYVRVMDGNEEMI